MLKNGKGYTCNLLIIIIINNKKKAGGAIPVSEKSSLQNKEYYWRQRGILHIDK